MNHVILIGRIVRDPDIRWTQGSEPLCIAKYTLAIDRPSKNKETDYISCIAFGKNGEFADKYLHKGIKIAVEGRIQTGSYTNKDGQKVRTTDVAIERQEFCEKADNEAQPKAQSGTQSDTQPEDWNEGFMKIPDNADAAGLPWND